MTISPDTKDWTWVLERPCDECGFDKLQLDGIVFAVLVRESASQWLPVLERDTSRRRPRDDRWSDLEYACHVRDVFRIFDQRLVAMLTRENPLFENWDQDATAVAERYDQQDPAIVGAELVAAAATYADRLVSVGASQWSRPGRRSNGSIFTVETLALYCLHDLLHHLWDVDAAFDPHP